jgi:hypothetical protein
MDESAAAALTAGNKAMEQRLEEASRHNKVIEDMEQKKFCDSVVVFQVLVCENYDY